MLLENLGIELKRAALQVQQVIVDHCDVLEADLSFLDSLASLEFWDEHVPSKLESTCALLSVTRPNSHVSMQVMISKAKKDGQLMIATCTEDDSFRNYRPLIPNETANLVLRHFVLWPNDSSGNIYGRAQAETAVHEEKLVMVQEELYELHKLPMKDIEPGQLILVVADAPSGSNLATALKVHGVFETDNLTDEPRTARYFIRDGHSMAERLKDENLILKAIDEHTGEIMRFSLSRFGLKRGDKRYGLSLLKKHS